ncbi:solute carrier family 25 member 35-like [Ostrea edulis]|uniref:solute carrier family 25 member 35-like n=1 Tax=Ostrea edulis TaxID=37623 RepID=UPI002096278C|nr:solute carrier family 25 member 35-like [Ostrea edulis]
MEFLIGGLAACGAGIFTNPLEVVKTRMQLQGELQARGQHAIHYRNSFHAIKTIVKTDGILAIQNGLVPALWYQLIMNGIRLGSYQVMLNVDLTKDKHGNISFVKSIAAGALAGCLGASIGSPFYMIKTHMQSKAAQQIAVGHQHPHESMLHGMRSVFRDHGFTGLWRGVSAAIPRVMVGSATQLSSFSTSKEYITRLHVFPSESWMNTFCATLCSALTVTFFMTPFDVVSTRMYNQGTDVHGKGLRYNNVVDCFVKIFRTEGLWGFYKGWGPSFLRLAPHTVLSLMIWDRLRVFYKSFQLNKVKDV